MTVIGPYPQEPYAGSTALQVEGALPSHFWQGIQEYTAPVNPVPSTEHGIHPPVIRSPVAPSGEETAHMAINPTVRPISNNAG